MMVAREVNSLKMIEYIKCAWSGDDNLPLFYDSSLSHKSFKGMVYDTHHKILDMYEKDTNLKLIGIDYDDQMVGFIALSERFNCLYSFGVKQDFRKEEVLKPLFFYITNKLKDGFFCMLNEYNTRAIKWLKKCGMVQKEYPANEKIVYLKYEKCP